MLLAVFLLAFVALKTCAARGDEISFEEAEVIARDQVDFEPDKVLVRVPLDAERCRHQSGVRDRPRGLRDRGDADRTLLARPV
jgi:hypothetical protein